MKISFQHRFNAPLERVVAMLQDESFALHRARAAGADDADVLVDVLDDGAFTVVIRRTVPTSSIPAEFRSIAGSHLSVRYTEAWAAADANGNPDDREGTFAVEIPGAPGHARGSVVLERHGDATSFGLAGDVSASVPLVGPMVEKAVAGAIQQALPLELEAADAWLAEHP